MADTAHIPFREVPYLPLKLKVDRRPDGTMTAAAMPPFTSGKGGTAG